MGLLARLKTWFNVPEQNLSAVISNTTTSSVLAQTAQVADTPRSRKRGLLRHDMLMEGQGLWIVPSSAVHSFGMKFEIDVIFIDRKHRVRKVRSGMKPRRIAMCLGAHSVVELPNGTIERTRTQRGHQLQVKLSSNSGGQRD